MKERAKIDVELGESTMKPIVRYEGDLELNRDGPFPANVFLSRRDTHSASVKKGTLEKGKKIEVHAHNENDQLEYYTEGEALMFVEGLGDIEIRKGSFTYIPKGTKHGILNVSESLTLLTVFVPPLF